MTTTMERERDDLLTKDETASLISSDKVEGTIVFDRNGERLGTVKKVMLTKHDGQVRYVVMGSGGLFGLGEDYTPLPWDALDYDTNIGGYRLKTLSKDDLEKNSPPRFSSRDDNEWTRDYERSVRVYYFPTI
ncbi:PRC-barrel domain-containing protein [Sphingomicrobium astaxanthinifaciens]|uniref:PRC-barrel domain-containing protein n=1 Tax=Sphingomicrobium astaxanthinifaciens TaxID=1227949 RepID=UPI001FCB9D9F|nr:PRC-barrel domain-containing protein [Sphingomicrobium astaxanthinifaciens]MCJ7421260.1 PRC-barrel domain-containing protein [Sphingomicrobium astaxanthinifaciens]